MHEVQKVQPFREHVQIIGARLPSSGGRAGERGPVVGVVR